MLFKMKLSQKKSKVYKTKEDGDGWGRMGMDGDGWGGMIPGEVTPKNIVELDTEPCIVNTSFVLS